MSSTTVAEFANELKKSADVLLDQLRSAGVTKASEGDALTDADKQKLLSYLQASHGTVSVDRKKITLVKKSTSEIKQADASGKARTIQVEVRKKRTLIKRDDEPVASEEDIVEPQLDHADLARLEEQARRQAELILRQEEELAEKRRLREAQEAAQRADLAAQEAQALAQSPSATVPLSDGLAAAKPLPSREEREQLARAEAASINAASQAKPAAPAVSEPIESAADIKAAAAEQAAQMATAKAEAAKSARDALVQKAAAESKAKADEDTARALDLDSRRRKALAEAEAIRSMMNAPKKVLVAKKEEPKAEPKVQSRGLCTSQQEHLHPVRVQRLRKLHRLRHLAPTRKSSRRSCLPAGRAIRPRRRPSPRVVTPVAVWDATTGVLAHEDVAATNATVMTVKASRQQPRCACLKCTSLKPSPCQSWPTKWPSRRLRSSSTS